MTRVESLLLCTLGTHSMCVSITKSFQFCSLALEHYSLKKASFITQLRNFHSQFVNFLKFTKYCSLHSQFALQKSRVQLKYPLTFLVPSGWDQVYLTRYFARESWIERCFRSRLQLPATVQIPYWVLLQPCTMHNYSQTSWCHIHKCYIWSLSCNTINQWEHLGIL